VLLLLLLYLLHQGLLHLLLLLGWQWLLSHGC
jgi:hypothetical protein